MSGELIYSPTICAHVGIHICLVDEILTLAITTTRGRAFIN